MTTATFHSEVPRSHHGPEADVPSVCPAESGVN